MFNAQNLKSSVLDKILNVTKRILTNDNVVSRSNANDSNCNGDDAVTVDNNNGAVSNTMVQEKDMDFLVDDDEEDYYDGHPG